MDFISSNGKTKVGRNETCPCGSGLKFKKCCLKMEEVKASPPPFDARKVRLEMEAMMGQIKQIAEQDDLSIEQLNEYFVGRNMDDIALEASHLEKTPEQQAQDLIYEAYDTPSAKKMILLAQRALEIDPDCVDAHMLLGDLITNDPIENLVYLEKAKKCGERKLGAQFFEENTGHFWGMTETRPYMRALQMIMQTYWELRRQSEAISIGWRMLELNPNDNQGVRYILFDYLLADDQLAQIPKLLKEFKDDIVAHWEYNKLLFYFKKFGADAVKTTKQYSVALKSNKFIPDYLNDKLSLPDDEPDAFALGSKEEAIAYVQDSGLAWITTSNAIEKLFKSELKLVGSNQKRLLKGR